MRWLNPYLSSSRKINIYLHFKKCTFISWWSVITDNFLETTDFAIAFYRANTRNSVTVFLALKSNALKYCEKFGELKLIYNKNMHLSEVSMKTRYLNKQIAYI